MATDSWSTRVRHDSDVLFREWGSEFAAKLAAVGLTQTADTGQINWVTVVRAAVNTEAGYEIWRFNDTQQATAPVFFRVGYGTGSNVSAPRIQFTVGTGSSGAGVITGTALTTARSAYPGTGGPFTSDTARQSYMSYAAGTSGFFGFCWKVGADATRDGGILIARTVDPVGEADATGALVWWGGSGPTSPEASQALRFAAVALAFTAQTLPATCALCLSPQARATSASGADTQAFVAYTIAPQVTPLVGMCGVYDSEVSSGSTFTATLVGSTARTYIGLTQNMGPVGGVSSTAVGGLKPAMLWE